MENSGANVGSTGKNTQLQFNINNTAEQNYLLTFKTGTKSAAKMKVTWCKTRAFMLIVR